MVGWYQEKYFRKTAGFKTAIFTIQIPTIIQFVENPTCRLDALQLLGLCHLKDANNSFVSKAAYNKVYQIQAFNSVSLESTDIIRAAAEFHGKPMFSNIKVTGDAGEPWYALVGYKHH